MLALARKNNSAASGVRRALWIWGRNPWLVGPVGLVMAASWMSAYAAWTDSVQVTTSTNTGTVNIQAGGSDTTYALTGLDLVNLLPGGSKYAGVVISNIGTVPVSYGMTTASTGAPTLATALELGVKMVPGGVCNSTTYAAGTAVSLYTLAPSLTAASFSSRALAASGSEMLCFQIALPSGADTLLQGLTAATTFTFSASA